MREEVYDIGGMHCAACSAAVERVTRKLAGVQRSDVNLATNRMTICYDETQCTAAEIVQKVERAGFSATPHVEEAGPTAPAADTPAMSARVSLWVSVAFAAALLVVSMGTMLFPSLPVPDVFSMDTHPVNYALLQLLLAVPVLVLGRRFFIGGFRSLLHGNPNMDTLVALSATASFLFSVVMTFAITDNPHAVHNLYYESAAVVVALVSVGKYLESHSKEKTKDAITGLIRLTPDRALLLDGGVQREVPTEQVAVGDVLLVKPGARVPLDGVVIDGAGSVNEAMLTGESLPVQKEAGSEVIGGSVSVDGALTVRVTRVGADTTLAQIVRFVEEAQGKKAPIAKVADKVAGVFVPIVLAVALVAAVVWLIGGAEVAFALRIFTSVLVIACPCAMGLATPMAIIVGTGLGATHGILVRSGEALEVTHKVTVAVLDKTGTLTEGRPTVTDIVAAQEDEVLGTALALEVLSEHPLARAIGEAAAVRGLTAEPVTAFQNVSGRGLTAQDAAGRRLLAGNAALLAENGVAPDAALQAEAARLQSEGKTVIFVRRGDGATGLIAVADTLKADAAEAVAQLKTMGVRPVLLTGDNAAAARYIGRAAGIDADDVIAEVLPTEKAAVVQRYQQRGEVVMMVGDGINDAPALVQADVGCAIGGGSDIAIDSADVVLMKQELCDVARVIRLGRRTLRTVKQNLFWAFCYNTLGIPVAAGVLYPAFHLLLSPMIGALAMSLSSLFVVTNALRLKGVKL